MSQPPNQPVEPPPAGGEESPYAAPVTEPLPGSVWDSYTPTGSQIRPWVRYWARATDLVLFCLVAGMVIGFVAPEWLEASDRLLGIAFIAVYRVVEAAYFAAFGTTPCKALLKVRVRRGDGGRLSFSDALTRSVSVWLRGEGLGIPLVSLITHVTAYNRLKQHGRTSWDQDAGWVVTHQRIEWWRWLVLVALAAGIIALVVYGSEVGEL